MKSKPDTETSRLNTIHDMATTLWNLDGVSTLYGDKYQQKKYATNTIKKNITSGYDRSMISPYKTIGSGIIPVETHNFLFHGAIRHDIANNIVVDIAKGAEAIVQAGAATAGYGIRNAVKGHG